jgi:hypothetical protein
MPSNKMTAKSAISRLKGYLILEKANVVKYNRQGNTTAAAKSTKNQEALAYAVAAVEGLKLNGKSAHKELARIKAGSTRVAATPTTRNEYVPPEDDGDTDSDSEDDSNW